MERTSGLVREEEEEAGWGYELVSKQQQYQKKQGSEEEEEAGWVMSSLVSSSNIKKKQGSKMTRLQCPARVGRARDGRD